MAVDGSKREERYDRLQANNSHDTITPPGRIPSVWAVAARVDLQEGFRFRMSMVGAQRPEPTVLATLRSREPWSRKTP